jgi:hypothetical protein
MNGYDTSIADVLRSVIRDAQDLVRTEVALAKAELRNEVKTVGVAAATLAGAAIAGLIAVVFLLTAGAWALPLLLGWPVWTGFAIVGVILAIVAGALGLAGKKRLNGQVRMPLTTETMKENVQWMRARTS